MPAAWTGVRPLRDEEVERDLVVRVLGDRFAALVDRFVAGPFVFVARTAGGKEGERQGDEEGAGTREEHGPAKSEGRARQKANEFRARLAPRRIALDPGPGGPRPHPPRLPLESTTRCSGISRRPSPTRTGSRSPCRAPRWRRWFREAWLPEVLGGLPDGVALVLLFDEFDVLADVQAKQAASALFPYLRRLLEKNAPRLRAVFVIGRNIDDLENVAHALFKGLPSCHVSLLARKDAEALVRLGEGNGSLAWSEEAVEAAWALTHGHPLLLQALCGHVWARRIRS